METLNYTDLRGFIEEAKKVSDWREIDGADWDLEIGALVESTAELVPQPPMLIFNRIKGYPAGFRVLSLPYASYKRVAVAFGLSPEKSKLEIVRQVARKIKSIRPVPPQEIKSSPVMENVMEGDKVDLFKFPAVRFHEQDGGRYIGTGDCLINADVEGKFINMGTYRMQLHERNLLGLWMSPGQHGRLVCMKYWEQGKSCPVVATFGLHPIVFALSHTKIAWGQSELDNVGGVIGRPLEILRGPLTGLPIPASSEIAIEGEVPPPNVEAADEGPFGEWPGYYSGGTRGTGEQQPIIRVKALYHRDDPIILSMPPLWPGAPEMGLDFKAALLWDQLESAGIQDVAGVWVHSRYLIVVAIKQRYA